MSTARSPSTRRAGVPAWKRWLFRVSAVFVVLPLFYLPAYFHSQELNRGTKGLGERELGEIAVGPWSVRFAEWRVEQPFRNGEAGYAKSFTLALCDTCAKQVKAAYLRVGKPRNLRAAGSIFFGSPYRQSVALPIPERVTADAELWITLEGWDGSVHQAALPLAEASPITIEWLSKRGNPT
ncbi:thiamine pyrophosphate-binding protein [Pseudothauera nasutitermitis]|uniref:Thiamine pyrophosphate-binding protein n=1 Tax=Pseudothauera nasutitermitis TaxID=2565930 RepID=A0A4S4B0X3_9RHOO|nr:thiamine pyrophosphate-binding protein [Pseudothauera nasutitermitis]THF66154.1 thiamine pyrophosphate-binding protein [Pseudothauera nasutitermitis]